MKDKFILDACCGPRMMWFNKKHPNCIYIDERVEVKGFVDNRDKREIKPDIQMDNRKMSFNDNSFKLVVWDPPHIIQKPSPKCRMTQTFGCLSPETWQHDLKRSFNECWRVLKDYGVLIVKWNECSKKLDVLLRIVEREPLFGQKINNAEKKTKDKARTYWLCFMKIPENAK